MAVCTAVASAVPVTLRVRVSRRASTVRTPGTSLTQALIARTPFRLLICGMRNDCVITVGFSCSVLRNAGLGELSVAGRAVEALTDRCRARGAAGRSVDQRAVVVSPSALLISGAWIVGGGRARRSPDRRNDVAGPRRRRSVRGDLRRVPRNP